MHFDLCAGQVEGSNPLYQYLSRFMGERTGSSSLPTLEIMPLKDQHSVYVCSDTHSNWRTICKFFGVRKDLPPNERRNLLEHEYRCLAMTRRLGLDSVPWSVVRPYAKVEDLGFLLTEAFVRGRSLDDYIAGAVHAGEGDRLIRKLELVADFLSRLHRLSWRNRTPNFSRNSQFLRNMVEGLVKEGAIESAPAADLRDLVFEWEAREEMWPPYSSWVHGDATPTNFLFHPEDGVTAIDLERMHVSDPLYDTGFVAAELRHHFGLRAHCAQAAEPFIARFLRRYWHSFSCDEDVFREMSFRNRFFMALGEIRIARNQWLPAGHRKWLVEESIRCLS